MESSVHPSVDFFLGATTPAGFKGYFAPLRREPGMHHSVVALHRW